MINVLERTTDFKAIADRYIQLMNDERNHLPEGHPELEELYREQFENWDEILSAYYYAHVPPGVLPEWMENAIFTMDLTVDEWDEVINFVMERAGITQNPSSGN